MKVGARVSLKVATKGLCRGKRFVKIETFRLLFWDTNVGVQLRRLECLWQIWNYYTLFSYIASGSGCTHFTESSHESRFKRSKKIWKVRFLDYFSNAKTEECHQWKWNDCNKFGMIVSSSVTYFLKVGARFSLKIAAKASFGSKKTLKI